jgi:hypothetical protein
VELQDLYKNPRFVQNTRFLQRSGVYAQILYKHCGLPSKEPPRTDSLISILDGKAPGIENMQKPGRRPPPPANPCPRRSSNFDLRNRPRFELRL